MAAEEGSKIPNITNRIKEYMDRANSLKSNCKNLTFFF